MGCILLPTRETRTKAGDNKRIVSPRDIVAVKTICQTRAAWDSEPELLLKKFETFLQLLQRGRYL